MTGSVAGVVGSANAKAEVDRVEGPRIKLPSVVNPLWLNNDLVPCDIPVTVIV